MGVITINVSIRKFTAEDAESLVKILKLNKQYYSEEVEGVGSMIRVSNCDAAVFLVAHIDKKPCGFVKAIYDGSRAMIHLLSIHPSYQGMGIGSKLVDEVINELKNRGAPSISVTVTEKSSSFWEKEGFEKLPVFLMLKTFK